MCSAAVAYGMNDHLCTWTEMEIINLQLEQSEAHASDLQGRLEAEGCTVQTLRKQLQVSQQL